MIKHNYPGKFIVVEGLDGSGKSSQVDLLIDFLKKMGKEVIITKEPTMDSESGRKIKQVLRKEIVMDDPLELQKLYVQDRDEHLKNKVIPALKEGKYVVSSRYYFSTFAYGGSDGLDVEMLVELNNNFLQPDISIIIDVPAESCMKRIEGRGELKEYFEELEKLKKIREFYKSFPNRFEQVVLIDGERPIEEVFNIIKPLIIVEII